MNKFTLTQLISMLTVAFFTWTFTGCSDSLKEETGLPVITDDADSETITTRSEGPEYMNSDDSWDEYWNNMGRIFNDSEISKHGGLIEVSPDPRDRYALYVIGPNNGIRSGNIAEYEIKFHTEQGVLKNIHWDFGGKNTARILEGQGTLKVKVEFFSPRDQLWNWKVSYKSPFNEDKVISLYTMIYTNQVEFDFLNGVRLGEISEIKVNYRNALSYEWKVEPNMDGFDIISTSGNTMVFRMNKPRTYYIYCRAVCDWGRTEWNFFMPRIMEDWAH